MPEDLKGERCLKVNEVASMLRIHPAALARLNRRGQGPIGFKVGGSRRWLESAVDDYLRDLAAKAKRIEG
jgi:predicted DNA-binding transcriptional regulator AlpA